MSTLRDKIIKLGQEQPQLQKHLRQVIKAHDQKVAAPEWEDGDEGPDLADAAEQFKAKAAYLVRVFFKFPMDPRQEVRAIKLVLEATAALMESSNNPKLNRASYQILKLAQGLH